MIVSLTEAGLFEVVKSQYLYKMKSRLGLFLSMAGMQVMGLLFSLGGVMSFSMGSQYIDLSVRYFSSDLVITFTFIWLFVVAVLTTTKEYQNIDFTFIANRLSSNLSNAAFLATAALFGAFTAMLSGFLLRIIVYFKSGGYLLSQNFIAVPADVFTGIAVTLAYLLLIGSLGYFCGVLAQRSKVFIVLLGGLLFGLLVLAGRGYRLPAIFKAFEFFRLETSLALLALKVILAAALFYACSIVLSDRLEVR
mgnify:CR=1 FL=1